MKKLWLIILAVLLVFGLAIGCGGGGAGSGNECPDCGEDPCTCNPGNLEETVVFDLATDEIIQALTLGPLVITDDDSPFDETLITEAGGAAHITFEAVAGPGSQAVSLKFTTAVDWGAGIDLRHGAMRFRAGDKVSVSGSIETLSGGRLQLNRAVGGEHAIATANTAGAFNFNVTLTEADVTAIRGGNPAALRLEARANGMVVKIDNIKVEGMRPTDGAVPEAGDFVIDNLLQFIDDDLVPVSIVPRSTGSTGAITIWYEGIAPTDYARSNTLPNALGTYRVTFDVAAATGFQAVTGLVAGNLVIDEKGTPGTLSAFLTVIGFTPVPDGLDAVIEVGTTTFGDIIGPHFDWVGATNKPAWVLNADDTYSLRVDATDGNFGARITLPFAEGDTITITGRTAPLMSEQLIINAGDWNPIDAEYSIDADAPFTMSGTFTAAQAVLPVRIMGNEDAEAGAHFFIDSISITRP
jgi:hypothetical protein